jgi:hypothetical protein
MGEARLKSVLALIAGSARTFTSAEGEEFNSYTREESDANRVAGKAALASQTPEAIRGRAFRERKKADPEFKNKERLRQKLIRANNPGQTRAKFKKWEDENPDWVDNYKEARRGLARTGEFIPIDSEGQNYPYADKPLKDIIYNNVVYPPHATYLWGAYSHRSKKALYLTDPRSKGTVKYMLDAKPIFDWLLNDVKETCGEANYVMFGMSYDMTQLFAQLPHNVTYEIFKGKRFDDEYEFDAPVFWQDYAIKLIQGKWLILWRLKDRNKPYMMDSDGEFILDTKGRMQLDTVQKIQIYETFGYFQTGFAKVVEDMMKEQKSSAAKQLLELNIQEEYINSAAYEAEKKTWLEKNKQRAFTRIINAQGVAYDKTTEQRLADLKQ